MAGRRCPCSGGRRRLPTEYLAMPRRTTLPPPRTPDPLFDDFIPPRLLSLMRRVHRRGGTPSQIHTIVMAQLLKSIDPRLEPLVDDVVERADGADGCIVVFMDLVGPEVAVGSALVFKLAGARTDHVDLAWRLAEEKAVEMPGKGSASEIAERLVPTAFAVNAS